MRNRITILVLSMAVIFFFVSGLSLAQNKPDRFVKQHKSDFVKEQLPTTESMLLKALKNDSTDMKISAVQTIRELEQIFPAEPFNSFIDPLCDIVRNENSETHLRILSALALDELHSDKGDKVLFDISNSTPDESVRNVCIALAMETSKVAEKLDAK